MAAQWSYGRADVVSLASIRGFGERAHTGSLQQRWLRRGALSKELEAFADQSIGSCESGMLV